MDIDESPSRNAKRFTFCFFHQDWSYLPTIFWSLSVVMVSATEKSHEINRSYEIATNSFIVKLDEFDSFATTVKVLSLFRTFGASLLARMIYF